MVLRVQMVPRVLVLTVLAVLTVQVLTVQVLMVPEVLRGPRGPLEEP